jgi:hypothetical protein
MNVRLIYEGPLPSNGDATEKQAIRNQLHPQLANLWNEQQPLKAFVGQHQLKKDAGQYVSLVFERQGVEFAPLVSTKLHLHAHLDILFLRPGGPGALIRQGGDIDNRLKTLFDALTIPDANQLAAAPPAAPIEAPWGPSPFFCVLEDDALITRVSVETDRLLKADVGGVGESRVLLVINVTLRASQLTFNNMDLVGG